MEILTAISTWVQVIDFKGMMHQSILSGQVDQVLGLRSNESLFLLGTLYAQGKINVLDSESPIQALTPKVIPLRLFLDMIPSYFMEPMWKMWWKSPFLHIFLQHRCILHSQLSFCSAGLSFRGVCACLAAQAKNPQEGGESNFHIKGAGVFVGHFEKNP